MKTLVLIMLLMVTASQQSIYDFKMNSLEGKEIDFAQYRGKNLLIVNVASKCGFTPQYADLEKLHEEFGDKVVVLGFPANNFGGQEPGTNLQIAEFCEKNYGVKFQMFEKISVKGDDQHPLYQWLKAKTGQEPSWNFCKYLVKPDGTVKFFPSKVKPLDEEIVNAL
jgi:glutathione peroxidase